MQFDQLKRREFITLDSTPDKFRRSLAADVALWMPVVKALGLKID